MKIINNPLISIIVPIFNDEKYLATCLDSIIKQTYTNIEIILVNDGSTDNSSAILSKYNVLDNRIHVINKENSGVSDSRNIGLNKASGDYVCFVDADDILSLNYIEYLHSLIQNNNAEIALTTQMFGNYDNKQVKKKKVYSCAGLDAAIQILSYNIPIGVYCKIFKTKFLRSNNIKFNKQLCMGEGFNFNFDAFQKATKVIISNYRIYYYRRDNPTSATTKFSMRRWENGIYAIELIRSHFLFNSKQLSDAWNYAYWRTYSDVFDRIILAKATKKYSLMFNQSKKIVRSKALYAWRAPVSKKDRVRATIMMVIPNLIPKAMILRNRLYNIKVGY